MNNEESRIRVSYTSANAFPWKMIKCRPAWDLKPVHVQWMPTNACNMRCPFCSCSERNRSQQMDIKRSIEVIEELVGFGMLATTITGGGEPLCHPDISSMIKAFYLRGVEVGLVTNGLFLDQVPHEVLRMLTWCRISNGDHRTFDDRYRAILDTATLGPVDWAFSHVVSTEPNLEEIRRIVEYANSRNFTHVRLVGDLLADEEVPFDVVKESLSGIDSKVIYQPRKEFEKGSSCLIGYVKPVVAPDFKMYLCCGVQYAIEGFTGGMPEELCMGSALDLTSIYGTPSSPRRKPPYQVRCDRCYYGDYNRTLSALTEQINHMDFI